MDHSAHGSMKNAASCETWCELQDTLSTDFSNAHCGLGSCPGPRLSEGRIRLAKEAHAFTWPHRIVRSAGSSCEGSSRAEKLFGIPALWIPQRGLEKTRQSHLLPAQRGLPNRAFPNRAESTPTRGRWPFSFFFRQERRRRKKISFCRPQIRRDDPLNLSI